MVAWLRLSVFAWLTLAMVMPALAQTASGENARIARLQAQIIELEEQIRILTGRLEEAEFSQRRTDQRLDRLIGDIDLRLRGIEGGTADMPEQANTGAATPPAALPTVNARTEDLAGANQVEPPAPVAGQEGVLGTIPRDALLGIRRPGDEELAATQPAADIPQDDPNLRYRDIQQLLAASKTADARASIESYLNDFPDDGRSSQLSFLLGETWYLDGLYANAAQRFAENVRLFGSNDERAPDNLLKLGMALVRIGDPERGCTAFLEFERRYPDASRALVQTAARERQAADCP